MSTFSSFSTLNFKPPFRVLVSTFYSSREKLRVRYRALRDKRELLEVCNENEKKLANSSYASLRLIDSTEVLESSLGSFKYLQRHHNRGTFTTLLTIYPALFDTITPEGIKRHLTNTPVAKYKEWVKKSGLNNSTQARKTDACKNARKARIETVLIE